MTAEEPPPEASGGAASPAEAAAVAEQLAAEQQAAEQLAEAAELPEDAVAADPAEEPQLEEDAEQLAEAAELLEDAVAAAPAEEPQLEEAAEQLAEAAELPEDAVAAAYAEGPQLEEAAEQLAEAAELPEDAVAAAFAEGPQLEEAAEQLAEATELPEDAVAAAPAEELQLEEAAEQLVEATELPEDAVATELAEEPQLAEAAEQLLEAAELPEDIVAAASGEELQLAEATELLEDPAAEAPAEDPQLVEAIEQPPEATEQLEAEQPQAEAAAAEPMAVEPPAEATESLEDAAAAGPAAEDAIEAVPAAPAEAPQEGDSQVAEAAGVGDEVGEPAKRSREGEEDAVPAASADAPLEGESQVAEAASDGNKVGEPPAKRRRVEEEDAVPAASADTPLEGESQAAEAASDGDKVGEPPAKRRREGEEDAPAADMEVELIGEVVTKLVQDDRKVLDIDGSVLEGGGQILRMACAYAAIFNQPLRVLGIRSGRRTPGLAAQHLNSLRLVRDVCGGLLEGDGVRSCEITIRPGALSAGNFGADPGTAGSVSLMAQASLFPLLFAGQESTCQFRGGTDVAWSPPLGFMTRVLQPMLQRMGASFSVECQARGFFPRGGGSVLLTVPRLRRRLQPIDLSSRGRPIRAHAVLHVTHPIGVEEAASVEAVRSAASTLAPRTSAELSLEPGPEGKYKLWVDIVVETTSGALFHGSSLPMDMPYGGRVGHPGGFRGSVALAAVAMREACGRLQPQLDSGAAVDVHLCDQLILPAALARGTSRLLVSELSLHARTALHISELLVPGFKYKEEPMGTLTMLEIDGIGHPVPGEEAEPEPAPPTLPPPSAPENEEARLPAGATAPAFAKAAVAAAPLAPPALAAAQAKAPPPPQQPSPPAPTPAPAPAPAPAAPANPNEAVLKLPAGSLSGGDAGMVQDFKRDMGELAEMAGIEVEVDVPGNRLLLRGTPEARKEVQPDLQEVLAFYFPR